MSMFGDELKKLVILCELMISLSESIDELFLKFHYVGLFICEILVFSILTCITVEINFSV